MGRGNIKARHRNRRRLQPTMVHMPPRLRGLPSTDNKTTIHIPKLEPLPRSSVEAYISVCIAIVCVVYPVTWYLKLGLLLVLWLISADLSWRSQWTVKWKKLHKVLLAIAFFVVLVFMSSKPLHKQYIDETRLPQSTLSISAYATNWVHKDGDNVGGIKWQDGMQDVRLVIEEIPEEP